MTPVAGRASCWYHQVMDNDWAEPYLSKACELVTQLDRAGSFSEERLRLEKQRSEWPEFWALIDTIAELKLMKEKFG